MDGLEPLHPVSRDVDFEQPRIIRAEPWLKDNVTVSAVYVPLEEHIPRVIRRLWCTQIFDIRRLFRVSFSNVGFDGEYRIAFFDLGAMGLSVEQLQVPSAFVGHNKC